MTLKSGGPAFPHKIVNSSPVGIDFYGVTIPPGKNAGFHGMTLRDFFAAKAMHGYISTAGGPCIIGGLDGAEDELAKQSYIMADAMLRAREAS